MTEKETIKDGLLEEFHENGQLKERGNYKNGEYDGPWEYFDEDGNPTTPISWIDGIDGELVEWTEDQI